MDEFAAERAGIEAASDTIAEAGKNRLVQGLIGNFDRVRDFGTSASVDEMMCARWGTVRNGAR